MSPKTNHREVRETKMEKNGIYGRMKGVFAERYSRAVKYGG